MPIPAIRCISKALEALELRKERGLERRARLLQGQQSQERLTQQALQQLYSCIQA